MSCKNMVDQTVPTRFSAKIVTLKCGSTGIDGSPLYCDACRANGAVSRPAWTYEDAGEADFHPELDAIAYEDRDAEPGRFDCGDGSDLVEVGFIPTEEDLENAAEEMADKIERRSGHDFNDDAVCLKCGFDGAEWSHLNCTAYRHEPRLAPACKN